MSSRRPLPSRRNEYNEHLWKENWRGTRLAGPAVQSEEGPPKWDLCLASNKFLSLLVEHHGIDGRPDIPVAGTIYDARTGTWREVL